jgi:hypothetical protein
MFMSMGWDYVSELRPPTGLLFIPQVIYEHEEQLRNDNDMWKLLIRLPELSDKPTSKVTSSKAGGTGEGDDEFGLK